MIIMRILQIGGTFVGAQRIIEGETHRWLLQHGHESHILYAIGSATDDHTVCYETPTENFLRRLLSKVFGKNPRFARPQTRKIVRYIKKWKPDVVHLHVLHHGYIDYAYLFDFLAREQIPVVFTMHDMWAATGGCYHYSTQQCTGYKNGCIGCTADASTIDCKPSQTHKYLALKKGLWEKLNSLCFVAVSPWVAEEMKSTMLSRYPIYTVWNAVNYTEAPVLLQKSNEKFGIIGVAACWDERKGINRFIELAHLLGEDYEIRLVGDVDPQIRARAPKNIVFLGKIYDRMKLSALYAEADLHISMSFEETFGMTFVEAAFAGTKSMGFHKTAIPYVVEKVFGYVIESEEVSTMADAVADLAGHREHCKLNADEIKFVKTFFSSDAMAENYYNVYKQVIENHEIKTFATNMPCLGSN